MHAGSPSEGDREAALSTALARLEADGAAILVGGVSTPGVVASAARRLMGRGDRDHRRILVVDEDTDPGGLLDGDARRDRANCRVVRYPVSTRSAVQTNGSDGRPRADWSAVERHVDPDAGAVGRAVDEAITEMDDGSLAPGDLRVWVDPLLAMLETHDRSDVVAFVRLLSDRVRGVGGRVHFRLPVRHGDRRLAVVAGLSDATVRLRLRERPEMCWHLDDGASSGWIPLEWTAGGP